ncbi:DnaA/Hda family protein [Bombella saccharophila]|uniref:DnaA/Hda family protein n=1 Tax=Bombella saccharophila TaxID=2967338 RepID=A0ABT3W872_9PROT|nr:DnaA/Hda family protein [Bombella saccharophila]MCX5613982.1 DnaA/Hda family protein [Bombella saccharophila]PHI97303.1 chromosomal replication initiator DnaA [Parasaccharibacter apium]
MGEKREPDTPLSVQAQLALDLQQGRHFSAERFIAGGSNASARAWLARPQWPEGRLWLWGPVGTGKTHLLHIWAAEQEAILFEAASLSCDHEGALRVEGRVLEAAIAPLAIDHLENLKDEVALLHVLNRAHAAGQRVLMASRYPPARGDFALPDLASRLRATVTAGLEEPEDDVRATLLLSLLAERQLVVPQSVTDWLWRRLPRTGGALVQAVQRLDKAAMARGSAITRMLAVDVLKDLLKEEE